MNNASPLKKILITGGTGQVGFELQRSLMLHGQILAPSRQQLDLTSAAAVDAWLETQQPDLIINAAAYTAVDLAETEQQQALRLNAELPEQLARYCQQRKIGLVHYSSDYVYPGSGTEPWQEDSATGPKNHYGQSKLLGDSAVERASIDYLIFRTSWVYSARGNNFMETMLRLGKERASLNVVDDQIGVPTPARLIAQVTERAISHNLASGVYHLAPRGQCSWQEFAHSIFQQAQAEGVPLAITPAKVQGIPSTDYPTPAARPLNSRLSLSKLENALEIELPDWQSQLTLTLKEYMA